MGESPVERRVVEAQAATITDRELDQVADFRTRFNAQFGPNDPPVDRAWAQADLHPGNEISRFRRLLGYHGDELVGMASVELELADNPNVVMLQRLEIFPDERYGDVAAPMVSAVLEIARSEQRSSFVSWGPKTPGCTRFWDDLGLPEVMVDRLSRVRIADIDGDIMAQWRGSSAAQQRGYQLHHWIGPCPQELLPAYVVALQGMNDAPTDDLAMDHPRLDEAWVRARERSIARRGGVLRAIVATAPDGSSAAMTEVQLMDYKPWHVMQQGTTTLPQHRGQGLGRWLKAEMLVTITEHHPEALVIETGNAASNAPMLAINTAMGFALHTENTTRQGDVSEVQAAIADL